MAKGWKAQIQLETQWTASRSSGAGGQNVNKVNSKVSLVWDFESSLAITPYQLEKIRERYSNLISSDGQLRVVSQKTRDQQKNLKDAWEKLFDIVTWAKTPVKKRKKTKPSLSSKRKRVDKKRKDSEKKKNRKRIDY